MCVIVLIFFIQVNETRNKLGLRATEITIARINVIYRYESVSLPHSLKLEKKQLLPLNTNKDK
jgi:hypothetical protein